MRAPSGYADIDVVDFLDPDQFVQAVVPSTSPIENLSSLLINGTKNSLQWRSEEQHGASARSNRRSVQIFMPRSEHRDAKVLLHVGGKDGMRMLRALNLLEAVRLTRPGLQDV